MRSYVRLPFLSPSTEYLLKSILGLAEEWRLFVCFMNFCEKGWPFLITLVWQLGLFSTWPKDIVPLYLDGKSQFMKGVKTLQWCGNNLVLNAHRLQKGSVSLSTLWSFNSFLVFSNWIILWNIDNSMKNTSQLNETIEMMKLRFEEVIIWYDLSHWAKLKFLACLIEATKNIFFSAYTVE